MIGGKGRRLGLEIDANVTPLDRGLKRLRRSFQDMEKANRKTTEMGFWSMFSGKGARDFQRGMRSAQTNLRMLQREHQRLNAEAAKLESQYAKQKAAGKVDPALAQQLRRAQAQKQQAARAVLDTHDQIKGMEEQQQEAQRTRKKRRRRMLMLGAAGLAWKAGSWIKGQADAGLQTAIENMMGQMESERLMGGMGKAWSQARREVVRYGNSLAYTNAETHKLAQQTARATGSTSMRDAISNLQMSRGYSLDPSMLFGYQTSYRQAGGRMGGGTRAINRSLLQSMGLGKIARPLLGELISSLTSLTGSTMDARERLGAGILPGLMGFMSRRLGGAYQQSPARTGRLLQGLHGTIAQTSGSDPSQAFLLRAAGFGGGKSYVQSLMQLEKGVTDPSNVRNLVEQVRTEFGGGEMGWLALHRLSQGKIKLHQAKRLMGADLSGMDAAGIQDLMGQQRTDMAGEAAKSRSGTGFVRRQIAKQNQRAGLRVTMDPIYEKLFQLEMAAMKKAAQGFNFASNAAKGLGQGLTDLNNNIKKGLGKTFQDIFTGQFFQKHELVDRFMDKTKGMSEADRQYWLKQESPELQALIRGRLGRTNKK